MRTFIYIITVVLFALGIGFGAQILIAQSREEGGVIDRIARVLDRQFGSYSASVAPSPPPPAQDTLGRSTGNDLPPNVESAIRATAFVYAAQTHAEIKSLRSELLVQAEQRDRDSFWTDVRLNTLFMLLGLGAPALLRRFGVQT